MSGCVVFLAFLMKQIFFSAVSNKQKLVVSWLLLSFIFCLLLLFRSVQHLHVMKHDKAMNRKDGRLVQFQTTCDLHYLQ